MTGDSKFKEYSLGYVAKDIIEDSQYIDVYPVELMPATQSEASATDIKKTENTNADGNIDNIQVQRSSLIKAKWLPRGNSNRLEPPTVCKGETVMLFKFGNTDKYFWDTMYNELHLRKNEKATFMFSNKKTIGKTVAVLKNSYYFIVDTINKFIRIHTDASDGEYTTYDIEIDTRAGMLNIADGKENQIELDSTLDRLFIKTNKKIETATTDTINKNSNDKSETIDNHYGIDLKTYHVSNGPDELIALIVELIQANIDEMHVGNLGIDTVVNGPSQARYKDIQSRVKAFMK